jgi:K+-transporting ATPase ATPase C chain
MLENHLKHLKTAFIFLIFCTLITGLVYPVLVTGLSQLFFPQQANGSLLTRHNQLVGSALIGQYFDAPQYFIGRPSATIPYPYNAANSSGSNNGPSNPKFLATLRDRITALKASNPIDNALIPVGLVTASASGLDPEISPAAARYQIDRISKARNISKEELYALIKHYTHPRTYHVLGESRVNVLTLNMALDARKTT